jgi:sugar phosphate permease
VPIGVNGFGLGLGLIVGPLFAIYLLKSFGWPWVFFGTGLVTLLWVVVLRLVLSNSPSKYRGMSNKDVTALDAEVGKGHSKNADSGEILKVRSFLSYPSTWGIIFGVFGIIYVQFFFLNWLPSYLVSVRHFTVIKSIFYTIIPSIGAAIGALLGGFLTDGLVRITKDHKLIARKIPFFALALLVALFQVPALLSPSPLVAVAVVAVINFMIQWGLVIIHTISIRIAGNRSAASFDSFVQVVFGLGAFASALFTGYLIHYSGFNGAAGISTIIGVITAVIFVILYRDIRLAKNPADEPQVPAAA